MVTKSSKLLQVLDDSSLIFFLCSLSLIVAPITTDMIDITEAKGLNSEIEPQRSNVSIQ